MRKLSERYALFGLMSLLILNGLIVEAQTLVKDIKPFRASSNPEQLTSVNGILYFVADDGIHGKELWKSDGTEQGTFMVKDIIPGTGDGVIKNLVNVGGRLFFAASNPQIINKLNGGETKLWKTDGTVAGTIELKDGVNNPLESLKPTNLTNVNGTLYYTNTLALGGQSSSGLFTSDGTDFPGTKKIDQFSLAAPELSHPSQLTELNGVLYFIYKGELHNSSAKIKTIITGENTDPGIQNMRKSGAKLFLLPVQRTPDACGLRTEPPPVLSNSKMELAILPRRQTLPA
jgi:ELWxxDGT repeat protein